MEVQLTLRVVKDREERTYLSTRTRKAREFFVSQSPSGNVKVASDIMASVTRSQISKIRYASIYMYYCDSSCRESLISVTKHLAYLIILRHDSTMLHALIAIAISLRHRSCTASLSANIICKRLRFQTIFFIGLSCDIHLLCLINLINDNMGLIYLLT